MDVPPQISFHQLDHSDLLEQHIRERISKLEEFSDHLVSCRVVVEAPHRSEEHIKHYRVRVEMSIPGKSLVAVSEPTQDNQAKADPFQVVDQAFDKAARQLKDYESDLQRGRDKRAQPLKEGTIADLREDLDYNYGFIEALDGRQVYFHENALAQGSEFSELESGQNVHFAEATGEASPEPIASTVRPAPRQQVR